VRARVRPRGRCTDRLKLDRLGRSLPHLIESMTSLATRGVGFRSITEAIDTTTPGGRLVFHLFGALGQLERDLIQERTRAGLVAAALRGRKGGRKPVVTSEKLERARALNRQGTDRARGCDAAEGGEDRAVRGAAAPDKTWVPSPASIEFVIRSLLALFRGQPTLCPQSEMAEH
jgi:Resolvase, N terminal domain